MIQEIIDVIVKHIRTLDPPFEVMVYALGSYCITCLVVCLLALILYRKKTRLKEIFVSPLTVVLLYMALTAALYHQLPIPAVLYDKLPMIHFDQEGITLAPLPALILENAPEFFRELISMVLFMGYIKLFEIYGPQKTRWLGWVVFRLCGVCLAIVLHRFTFWAIARVDASLLEGFLPMIGLSILAFMVVLGLAKYLLDLLLPASPPIIVATYDLFFHSKLGKVISGALFSGLIATGFFWQMSSAGYGSIPFEGEILATYTPFCQAILLIWLVIGLFF